MRVLVTVATRYGATRGIAEAICDVLAAAGHDVTSASCEDPLDVRAFDAVVVGSAVYAGRWLEPARELVTDQADALQTRPVWLFSSGPIGDPPRPVEDPADAVHLVRASAARDHQVFAGKLDREGLRWADRAIAAALRVPAGDFRDFEEVRRWAEGIATTLSKEMADS